ncbi:MAG: HPr family phosphocarrier protein [Maricaulaceae bacterium]
MSALCDKEGAIIKRVTLINKRGLHARASAKFVACAEQYDAEIHVTSHNDVCAETVVADSIMELLMLGSACGEDISISAIGSQAQAAVDALSALVNDHFGEGE